MFLYILARSRYTYIECIVITMYVFSMTHVFNIVFYLTGGLLFGLNVLHWAFYLAQILVSLGYTIWVIWRLFRHQGIKMLWLRIVLFVVVSTVVTLQALEWMSNLWVILVGEH